MIVLVMSQCHFREFIINRTQTSTTSNFYSSYNRFLNLSRYPFQQKVPQFLHLFFGERITHKIFFAETLISRSLRTMLQSPCPLAQPPKYVLFLSPLLEVQFFLITLSSLYLRTRTQSNTLLNRALTNNGILPAIHLKTYLSQDIL